MAGFYEPEILSRVQQMELEILKDVMDLCDSNGLLCFGMAGQRSERFGIRDLFPGMMTLTLPCQGRILSAF